MNNYVFQDIVCGKEGLLKGPFGSDLKRSLYVEKTNSAYKVYLQENILDETLDAGDHYISKEYYESKMSRYAVKENDFIVTCDGTLGEIYQLKGIKEKGIISSSLLRITLNPQIVDYDYFYYLFKFLIKKELIIQANNSVLKHLPGIEIIRKHPISLPDMNVQKKIGAILASIDAQIKRNNEMVQKLQVLGKTIYSKKITNCLFDKMSLNAVITTGKEDANHAKINGKYKFFTCGDNSLMCDDFKFEGKSVLVAGNGNFNVKYYDGKFNAYQRTYIVKNDKIIGNLYYTLLFNTELFRKKSNGSIIKFITIDMLNKIDVPIFSNEINNALNKILSKINEIQSNIFKLNNFKEILIPILINGQLQ